MTLISDLEYLKISVIISMNKTLQFYSEIVNDFAAEGLMIIITLHVA